MSRYENYSGRIVPRSAPFPDDIQQALDAIMRGNPPLVLFTTLARDPRLFFKFFAAGLLDRGNLTLRQREIVIDRVTARCGAEYEWGVHVATFAAAAQLSRDEIRSVTSGGAEDGCWADSEQLLIRLCDSLHADCDVPEQLWQQLSAAFTPEAILELLMLAGNYRTVSYLVKSLRLPAEPGAASFVDYSADTPGRPA